MAEGCGVTGGTEGEAGRRHAGYARWGKRAFDLAAAGTGLLVVAIPLAAIMVLSRLVQGSPVLFSQRRVGRFGRPFTLWKLRTMRVRPRDGSPVTVAGDARVTQWGAWLRRYKLDELPQLVCVLLGSMSFVGPRPDVPGYWDRVTGRDRELLHLRPGITGPATLLFRDEEEILATAADPRTFNDEVLFPEKVRLARLYMDRMSLLSDLKLIVYTLLPERWLRHRLASDGWEHRVGRGEGR